MRVEGAPIKGILKYRTRLRIWLPQGNGGSSPPFRTKSRATRCGTLVVMNPPNPQPKLHLTQASDYREIYSNSVQVRVSVWDFLLVFGLVNQQSQDQVSVQNTMGVYLSPQQAKALWNILGQNLAQYEQTFGNLALEPQVVPKGPVH